MEETHWKEQIAGTKPARKRCIYFEIMENDISNNAANCIVPWRLSAMKTFFNWSTSLKQMI